MGPALPRTQTLVDEDVDLAGCTVTCTAIKQQFFEFKVRRSDWPAGTYSLSVTGSGSETATAVSTFTVPYDK
jgi:hypothetical protein